MKKIFTLLMTLVLAVAITGCGGGKQPASSGSGKPADGAQKNVTLKVGATPVPHAEILEIVKPLLAKEGIDLQIVEFSDYVQPNLAVNDKELDANFFQHIPYLDNFVAEHKDVKLKNAGGVHIEPMGIYSHKVKKLDELKDGASIAIPNDPTNGGRALNILAKAGLLKLKDGVGIAATVNDIVENPKNLKIQEAEAAMLPRTLDDVDLAVINSNFAMEAKLNPTKDAIFIEPKDSPYANIVAVRKGDENRPEIQKLKKALLTDDVRKFLEDKYKGSIVPAF